jgi:hypothetical protein
LRAISVTTFATEDAEAKNSPMVFTESIVNPNPSRLRLTR